MIKKKIKDFYRMLMGKAVDELMKVDKLVVERGAKTQYSTTTT